MKRVVPLPLLLVAAVLVARSPALAGDVRTWQKAQHEIDRDAKKFWSDFTGRFPEAYADFLEPVEQAYQSPKDHKEAVYDYSGIDKLYAEAREFGTRRGTADQELDMEDEKARDALWKDLLDDAKDADRAESDLEGDNPDFGGYAYDQEAGCRIEAVEARLALARPVLARAPVAFLTGDAWKKAERADGRKSTRRRLALIDAVGARGDAAALEFLRNALAGKEPVLRVAAAQAMVACGIDTRPLLELDDAPVRRAVLRRWAQAPDPAWFGAVLAHAGRARGFERDLAVRLMAAISNQKFGHDLARWQAWFAEYQAELEGGKFDVKNVEVAEAKPAPATDSFPFYGLRVPSSGAMFVLEASSHMAVPADVDVQRTQWRGEWRGQRNNWEKEHVAHQTVVSREFKSAFAAFPSGFSWGMVTLFGKFATKSVGEKRLLRDRPGDLRAALKLIEQAPEKGWGSPLFGLMTGAELGGDGIDTLVLWHTGDPAGGRFMSPGPAAAAWRRFNRGRQLQVIAIRISNRKEPAEALMKALAEESGGQYLWAKSPPPSGG